MQHVQMPGIRNHLRTRGVALRMENGKYTVSHFDSKHWPEVATFPNLEVAYVTGLRMASIRESANEIRKGLR